MANDVTLHPIEEHELAMLTRLEWDPALAGEFQWFGFRFDKARRLEARWREDGLVGGDEQYLAVRVGETTAGWVDWREVNRHGAIEIGIQLLPDHRGRGVGTAAQRLLVDHLFGTTRAHRIQAGTEVGNVAEQRALEKVGFRREGVHRGLYLRAGEFRDAVMYGLLRTDDRPRVPPRLTHEPAGPGSGRYAGPPT